MVKDKNGKEIKVGDKVLWEFFKDHDTVGVVIEIRSSASLLCRWQDFHESTCTPSNCTVIQTDELEEFTTEDQEQLDKLLLKQQNWILNQDASIDKVRKLASKFYDGDITLSSFMIQNIDEICGTLLSYKKYHG